jgi:hypothetical protein
MDPGKSQIDDAREMAELEKASRDLKARIDEEKRRNDMPLNASLGDPKIDADNADGRNDLPKGEDDD